MLFFNELGIFDYAKQKEDTVTLPEEQALEALLNHSIETGIPLPGVARTEDREIDGLYVPRYVYRTNLPPAPRIRTRPSTEFWSGQPP